MNRIHLSVALAAFVLTVWLVLALWQRWMLNHRLSERVVSRILSDWPAIHTKGKKAFFIQWIMLFGIILPGGHVISPLLFQGIDSIDLSGGVIQILFSFGITVLFLIYIWKTFDPLYVKHANIRTSNPAEQGAAANP